MTRDDPGMRLARAQRLTGRATELDRAEARSAVRGRGVPGGSHVRPTRTTEPGSRDDRPHTGATSLQTCLVFSAPRPRPSKSPGIHRKNSGPPPSDPGVRSSAGLGGGAGSLERTRLARRQANKRRIFDGSLPCPASNSLTGSGGVSWRAASVPPHRRISCCPRASRIPGSSRMIPEYPGLKLGSCLAGRRWIWGATDASTEPRGGNRFGTARLRSQGLHCQRQPAPRIIVGSKEGLGVSI